MHGNHYGTHINQVKNAIKTGKICVLDLSVDGAKQVYATGLTCNFLFVTPPTREELKARLESQKIYSETEIQPMLDAASLDEKAARDAGFF